MLLRKYKWLAWIACGTFLVTAAFIYWNMNNHTFVAAQSIKEDSPELSTSVQTAEETVRSILAKHSFPQAEHHFVLQNSSQLCSTKIGGETGKTDVNYDVVIQHSPTEPNTFSLELTKDWNVNISGQDVVSYWEYEVNEDTYTLLTEENNDDTVKIIK